MVYTIVVIYLYIFVREALRLDQRMQRCRTLREKDKIYIHEGHLGWIKGRNLRSRILRTQASLVREAPTLKQGCNCLFSQLGRVDTRFNRHLR